MKKKGSAVTLLPKRVVRKVPNKKAINISVQILADDPMFVPQYQTNEAACADLVANVPLDAVTNMRRHTIPSRTTAEVDVGFSMAIPEGYKACIVARSSLAKRGLIINNAPGQVDSDYRGRVKVLVINIGKEIMTIDHGERFAQMYLEPVYRMNWDFVENLDETERGSGGFGSTGKL